MRDWEVTLARAREEFIEALARQGFRMVGGALLGVVSAGEAGTVSVEIRIPDAFPYRSPKVRPIDRSGELSWHQEPEGWLCLYAEDSSSDLPWADPDAFLERTVEWFRRDLAGWPEDPPDLDLERYIESVEGFVIYRDLGNLVGKPIRGTRRDHGVIDVVGTGTAPKKRQRGRLVFGWAEDQGELERPVRDWADVAAILGARASRLEREIHARRGELLLLRYRRGTYVGAVALRVTPGSPGST
jgi:hypothetical protein